MASPGRKVTATPAELPAVVARIRRDQPGTCIIVDGLFAELGPEPLPDEAVALLHMVPSRSDWCKAPPHVITTSAATANAVAGISRSTTVVPPGLDQCFDLERLPPKQGAALKIVCVGTISPGKGQVRLVRLLASIPQPWRLTLIGSFDPASEAVAELRRTIKGKAARAPAGSYGKGRGRFGPGANLSDFGRLRARWPSHRR